MKEMTIESSYPEFFDRSVTGGNKSGPGLTVMGPVNPGRDWAGAAGIKL
jgi:hypothetical protein